MQGAPRFKILNDGVASARTAGAAGPGHLRKRGAVPGAGQGRNRLLTGLRSKNSLSSDSVCPSECRPRGCRGTSSLLQGAGAARSPRSGAGSAATMLCRRTGFSVAKPDASVHGRAQVDTSEKGRLVEVRHACQSDRIDDAALIGAEHRCNVLNFVTGRAQQAGGFRFGGIQALAVQVNDVERNPGNGVNNSGQENTPFLASECKGQDANRAPCTVMAQLGRTRPGFPLRVGSAVVVSEQALVQFFCGDTNRCARQQIQSKTILSPQGVHFALTACGSSSERRVFELPLIHKGLSSQRLGRCSVCVPGGAMNVADAVDFRHFILFLMSANLRLVAIRIAKNPRKTQPNDSLAGINCAPDGWQRLQGRAA